MSGISHRDLKGRPEGNGEMLDLVTRGRGVHVDLPLVWIDPGSVREGDTAIEDLTREGIVRLRDSQGTSEYGKKIQAQGRTVKSRDPVSDYNA